jgi:mannose-6-phosphate isomerase-like protein (cupin superfamily)
MQTLHLLTALVISSAAIISYAEEGFLAPNTHYLGEAWLQFAMPADSLTGHGITKALFKANSTLNWHKLSSVQVLVIVDGVGYYQERGKEPVIMKEGDIIKCQPGTEHWHSSFQRARCNLLGDLRRHDSYRMDRRVDPRSL